MRTLFFLHLIFLTGGLLFAGLIYQDASGQSGSCDWAMAAASLDANSVDARLFNDGFLFWNPMQNGHYIVPKDGSAGGIFSASLWIGGETNGQSRSAASTWGRPEFWPGPLPEDGSAPVDCSAHDRIYKVSRVDVARYEATGIADADLADWPWELGAPVLDGDGIADNYDLAAGDRPALVGDQALWWIMNDAGGAHEVTNSPPLSVEVRVLASAFSQETFRRLAPSTEEALLDLDHTTFYRYEVTYRGEAPLENAYVGIYADADVGNAADDYVGSDSLLGLAFSYNGDDFDDSSVGYGSRPAAVGLDFVRGLVAPPDGLDNNLDGQVDEEGERYQMTRFVSLSKGATAMTEPSRGTEFYRIMRGYWRDGTPVTFGGIGYGGDKRASFMYPAMPPDFWSMDDIDGMGTRFTPSDTRFLMAMGPVHIQPGATLDFSLAIVWARSDDRLDAVRRLKSADERMQLAVDHGLLDPDPRWVQSSSLPAGHVRALTHRFGLKQNHPNPFVTQTIIPFEMAAEADVRLSVSDVLGREVAVLIDERRRAGKHEVLFDADGLSPGAYLVRMETVHQVVSRPMIVTK